VSSSQRLLSEWETLLSLPPPSLFVGILWPGDARLLRVVDYPFEDAVAIRCGRMLGPYIDRYFPGSASVSFVSHSLGARIVLESVRAMAGLVREVALMAGAVDDDCLTGQYRSDLARVGAVSVLASAQDEVLSAAFPIGNLFAGIVSRGHPYWHAALGHLGPQTGWPGKIEAGWQIPDAWVYGHGDYLPPAGGPVGGRLNLPVDVPPRTAPVPPYAIPWKPAWSAGVISTRLR